MKSKVTILSSMLLLFAISLVFASPILNAKYFEGKWEVLIKDTPQGSATIPMRFETVDDVTTGYFYEEGSKEESKMSSVKISEDVLSAAFNISGYDVTLNLKKVDEETAKGDLMGMFDAIGTRVK
ncbi:cytochrome c [Algoriphagus iocasae]|uniref:Cytochrome c n=1 Tax=Algoriphagus iocasae TaxID=1836499 RepID=A0A841MJD7_9BACT|nr:hypothetical protein [Algoriphagus iocasae]MBB6328412.1 cytochrome c [Algoriphagus iocasae]